MTQANDVAARLQQLDTTFEQEEVRRTRTRAENFTFDLIGLKAGDLLTFSKDRPSPAR